SQPPAPPAASKVRLPEVRWQSGRWRGGLSFGSRNKGDTGLWQFAASISIRRAYPIDWARWRTADEWRDNRETCDLLGSALTPTAAALPASAATLLPPIPALRTRSNACWRNRRPLSDT